MIDDRTDQPERGNTERRSTSPRALAAPGAVLHRPRSACLNPVPIKAQRLPQQRVGRCFSNRSQSVMPIDGALVATSSPQMRQEAL